MNAYTMAEPERTSRLLRLEEVLSRAALGRTAIYERIARGEFPPPIKLGRASRWLELEVAEWITGAAQARGRASR